MTAEEKGTELIEKFYRYFEPKFSEEGKILQKEKVKQCAIICVDEILNEFPQGYKGNFEERRKQYWQSVRKSITNK